MLLYRLLNGEHDDNDVVFFPLFALDKIYNLTITLYNFYL